MMKAMRFGILCLVGSAMLGCVSADLTNVASVPPTPEPSASAESEETFLPDPARTRAVHYETIDERTKAAGLRPLRGLALKDHDIEIRVWAGFGLTTLEGYIISRRSGTWNGSRLFSDYVRGKFIDRTATLTQPNSGWDAFWEVLQDHRILSLPVGESINCSTVTEDGFSYVFEIRKGRNYRTYAYRNPEKCVEAGHVYAIYSAFREEFNVN